MFPHLVTFCWEINISIHRRIKDKIVKQSEIEIPIKAREKQGKFGGNYPTTNHRELFS